jgi:uncharacterized protein (DUF488 family)
METTGNKTIWTIGHSNHPIEKFISLLKAFDIELLADIRTYPGSRYCPQFNKEQFQQSLNENNIEYMHMPGLGGRRKTRADSHNTGWKNASFRGYADYMETDEFKNAFHNLEDLAQQKRIAYMCSESLWWSCHRSLVSDVFKLKGWNVLHIMPSMKTDEHRYTSPAKIINGKLDYSKDTHDELFKEL